MGVWLWEEIMVVGQIDVATMCALEIEQLPRTHMKFYWKIMNLISEF